MLIPLRALIVGPSNDLLRTALMALWDTGFEPTAQRATSPAETELALASAEWDVVLADPAMPAASLREVLEALRRLRPEVPAFVLANGQDVETAADLARAGVADLINPSNLGRMGFAVRRELRRSAERKTRQQAETRLRREVAQAQFMMQTAAWLNAQPDLPAVLKAVCEATVRALAVPVAAVSLRDERRQNLTLAAVFGLPPGLVRQPLPSAFVADQRLNGQSGTIHLIPDARSLPASGPSGAWEALDLRTVAGAPMMHAQAHIGQLTAASTGEARALDEDDLFLLRCLADMAATAVANALGREAARLRLDRIQALGRIAACAAARRELGAVLDVVLDEALAQLPVDAADVLLFDPCTQRMEFAAGRGLRSPDLQQTRLRLGEGYAGRAAQERRVLRIPNLGEANALLARAPLVAAEGFTAYIAVPLIARDRLLGVLEILHRSELAPDAEWIGFLEALVDQAAAAVDSAALMGAPQTSG